MQTVAFTSTPPAQAVVGGTYTATASGGASGLPVVFSLAAGSDACTVGATRSVAFTGLGPCVIAADQAGTPTTARPRG